MHCQILSYFFEHTFQIWTQVSYLSSARPTIAPA
jgi:hypothetical protein